MKILLVCSSGGHFKAMQQLQDFWETHDHVWVTFQTPATETALNQQKVYWIPNVPDHSEPGFWKALRFAWQILRREKPNAVLSTGANITVPFLILARLMGSQTIFIESITRVSTLSQAARLSLPFLHTLYVHWPQLQARYPMAELIAKEAP